MASKTFVDGVTVVDAAWLQDVNDAIYTSGTQKAADIANVPAGNIAATDVQTAINELDTEKQPIDALLTALAAQTTSANKVQAYSGADSPTLLSTGISSGNIPLIGTKSATTTLAGLVEQATQAEAEAGTDDTVFPSVLGVAQEIAALKAILGIERTLPAGATDSFTSLPAGLKRITVMFNGVSTNGSSPLLLRIGDSGGIETTGYVSGAAVALAATNSFSTTRTDGYVLMFDNAAADVLYCIVTLTRMNTTHTWLISGTSINTNGSYNGYVSGIKTLSAELTQLQLTTVNGTDHFDAGTWNILYE